MTDQHGDTEEKIRLAAKKHFTEKGFRGATLRDVAKEAGVNVALVNYYFRSKEKLFHSIFMENFCEYREVIRTIATSEDMSLAERIGNYVDSTINEMRNMPNLPMFIMGEMAQNPELFMEDPNYKNKVGLINKNFMDQVKTLRQEKGLEDKIMDAMQLESCLSGLVIFPFMSKPAMLIFHNLTESDFDNFLEEHKIVVTEMILAYLLN